MPILSVATKPDPGLNLFLASCELNQIKPIIIGMNDPRPMDHKVNGMGLKLVILSEYLEKNANTFKDDEIFLVSDAFDVIVVEPWDHLVAKYHSLHSEIIVSVEKNCHPDPKLAPAFDALAPNKPWRYINTGSLMMPFGTLKRLIKYRSFTTKTDDQLWFQEVFFDKSKPFQITLDYNCELFQTVFDSFEDISANLKGRWLNRITNSSPSIIHGNAMPVNMLLHLFRMTFPLVGIDTKNS